MRLAFFILLLLNIALYPFVAGLVGGGHDGAEPGRLSSQIEPDRIRIVLPSAAPPAGMATTADAPPGEPVNEAPGAPAGSTVTGACRALAGLAREQVDALAARIREQQLAAQMSETEQVETTSWWVHIPDLPTRQLAERKVAELRALGVRDMIVMAEPADAQKLAVSLGLFKTEAAAKELLATLSGQGVRSARIAAREGRAGRYRVELRGEPATLDALLAATGEATGGVEPADCR